MSKIPGVHDQVLDERCEQFHRLMDLALSARIVFSFVIH